MASVSLINAALWMQNVDYPASRDRSLIDALYVDEGVIDGFAVSVGGGGLEISIAGGRCIVQGDEVASQGKYLVDEDAATLLTLGSVGSTRTEYVYIAINDTAVAGGRAGNDVSIETSESAPPDSAILLATLTLPGGTSTITSGMITDSRTYADVVADGAVTVAKLADGAVTEAKIDTGAVTAVKIATGVLPTPTPWTNVPISGSFWSSPPDFPAQYRKVGDIVWFRGVLNVTGPSPADTIGTMPVGFRPGVKSLFYNQLYPIATDNASGYVKAYPAGGTFDLDGTFGHIVWYGPSSIDGTSFYLDGVCYSTTP